MAETDRPDVPDPGGFTDPSPSPSHDSDLAVLGDALQECGVTRVVVRYEGSGDEGAANDVAFDPPAARVPAWLHDRLCDAAEAYCPDGYEDNEGGYGTLTVYPALGLAALEHRDRYEDAEDLNVGGFRLPAALRRRLAAAGAARITAHFDGSGDYGAVDRVEAEPEGVALGPALEAELEDFLLARLPGGWEINSGSHGAFVVEVPAGRVVVDAAWRVDRDAEPLVTRWKWGGR